MKQYLTFGATFALLAVIFGAFGTHALKNYLATAQLHTFEIGVRYQFYHAFALILVFALSMLPIGENNRSLLAWAGRCFSVGILLFSGSVYLLACREILPFSVAYAGPITPIGGAFFIAGWCCILAASLKK
ncbi:MAG: hypothetical protein RI894_1800 [Bacteroidota bacterium]|jgi:uncharacterized membrane protein YgdD (TMEM256/DUF423 family)